MAVRIKKKGSEQADPVGNALGAQSTVTLVKATVKKEEKALVQSNALSVDDEFDGYYFGAPEAVNPDAAIIRPPFVMSQLSGLVLNNNSLGQLVTAMEVNIDGTGFDIDGADEGEEETDEEDEVAKGIMEFFDEVYPGESFVTVRRKLRRDQESMGNAYLEVLRSLTDDITFAKHVDGHTMRMVRLDDAVPVTVTVRRFGVEQTVTMLKRERRFVQKVGNTMIYFKEFGASRDLDKNTGEWAPAGTRLPADIRATEIIHFMPFRDVSTPYGLPRWISQVPSVLGSRKAEELNLDFFNAGGLPPAMVLIQGGELTDQVRKQLNTYLSGKGSSKHRAAIAEIPSSGGTLDSAGNVKVTVERFGAERQQDSMFEGYDSKCESRVRSSFRLPPLFVGKAEDYSFATAFASYTVAEAQVFKPERDEFDEIMNVTIMREVAPDYTFRSLPLSVKDATQQLKGVEMAKDKISAETLVESINEIVGTNLKMKEGADDEEIPPVIPGQPAAPGAPVAPAAAPAATPAPAPTPKAASEVVQKMDPMELVELSREWAGYSAGTVEVEDHKLLLMRVKSLKGEQRDLFDAYVTMSLMSGMDHDAEGAIELTSAATEILAKSEKGCGC